MPERQGLLDTTRSVSGTNQQSQSADQTEGETQDITTTTNGGAPVGGVDWGTVLSAARQQYNTMNGTTNPTTRKRKIKPDPNAGRAPQALLCLSLKNPIRKACMKIVDWR